MTFYENDETKQEVEINDTQAMEKIEHKEPKKERKHGKKSVPF